MPSLLTQINQDVKDIFQHNIETTNTFTVPSRDDVGLTFPIGGIKKGKILETCVLFVDIRNSTSMSKQLKKDKVKLGKIYSAFIYAMSDIADEFGYVRNIVGDRVMVVFEPKDCFTNAINCAACMYTASTSIVKKHSGYETFKVGIGIEFGEMLVLKAGIIKKHEEQSEYKNLVWVGDAANIASKLTDIARKDINSSTYKITYEYLETIQLIKPLSSGASLFEILQNRTHPQYEWKSERRTNSVVLSATDFLSKISWNSTEVKYEGKKVIHIEKSDQSSTASPILMSGKVYKEFKNANPKSPYLPKIYERTYPGLPYTGSGVYGGTLLFPEIIKTI